MTYDELEEQYYILSQRNTELERDINSLVLRNTQLEASAIALDSELRKLKTANENLATCLQEETLKTINVKVQLEAFQKKHEELSEGGLTRSAVYQDAEVLQAIANRRDFLNQPYVPSHSVHLPMQEISGTGSTSVILRVTDSFAVQRLNDPQSFARHWHAYAKLGDRVVRYSTQESMFDLSRREDFAVVLNQMTDGLKEAIIDEYVKSEFR